MHSRLTDFQRSGETINRKPSPERDWEEFLYPFSPVRRRKTPQPPPKVKVNIEGTYYTDLSDFIDKRKNPAVGVRTVTINKFWKTKETDIGNNMNDFRVCTDSYDDDCMFNKQPEIFMSVRKDPEDFIDLSKDLLDFSETRAINENTKVRYDEPQSQRNRHLCFEYNLGQSNSDILNQYFGKDTATLSTTNTSSTFREFCALRKLRNFYLDLQEAEKVKELGAPSKARISREAKVNLSKWNRLLHWLDKSNVKPKFEKYYILKNVNVKKTVHEDKKLRLNQQKIQTNHNQSQQKKPTKRNKLGQISPTIVNRVKENDAVVKINIAEKRPVNSTNKRNRIKKTHTNIKKRATVHNKNTGRNNMKSPQRKKLTMVTRKLWANIKKRCF